MIAGFLAAAMTALTPSTASLPPPTVRAGERVFPDARPALWVVNDHDTVIFLFGTFHALDGQSEWFNDEVKTAFSASNELILETLVPKMPPMPVVRAPVPQAFRPGAPVGPVGPVAGSASFLSTSKMVMSAGKTRGMSTDKGADTILRAAAEESGKQVGGLESFEYQLRMFGSMRTNTPTPKNPEEAAKVSAALAAMLEKLQDAWNRGDIESFAPMLEDMRVRSPEVYKLLFADRNARWAGWIAQRLQQPGTVFVAVGAGHLAGRDSVQSKLSEAGIRSARIN
jgi:uncharacterized protein